MMKWLPFINRVVKFQTAHCDIFHGIVIGITTGYLGAAVRVQAGSRILNSSYLPNLLWGPPKILTNVYRGSFLRNKVERA
jgi:hypothetical protein